MQASDLGLTGTAGDNMGTSPSLLSIKGDNDNGIISFITGTDCDHSDMVLNVAFSFTKAGSAFYTILTARNSNAKSLTDVECLNDASGFTINNPTNLSDSSLYEFYYQCYELIPV